MICKETIENAVLNLRRENHSHLSELYVRNKLSNPSLKDEAGIYALWWVGDIGEFTTKILKCPYYLKGSNNKVDLIPIEFTKEWIENSTHEGSLCLYIGKTTKLRSRVSSHIRINKECIWGNDGINFEKKPNTVSQLRIGLDRIFNASTQSRITKDVSVSWIKLEGESNCINRFYIENYAIGKYMPLLNIDIER